MTLPCFQGPGQPYLLSNPWKNSQNSRDFNRNVEEVEEVLKESPLFPYFFDFFHFKVEFFARARFGRMEEEKPHSVQRTACGYLELENRRAVPRPVDHYRLFLYTDIVLKPLGRLVRGQPEQVPGNPALGWFSRKFEEA
jgi:hypothetical protein